MLEKEKQLTLADSVLSENILYFFKIWIEDVYFSGLAWIAVEFNSYLRIWFRIFLP